MDREPGCHDAGRREKGNVAIAVDPLTTRVRSEYGPPAADAEALERSIAADPDFAGVDYGSPTWAGCLPDKASALSSSPTTMSTISAEWPLPPARRPTLKLTESTSTPGPICQAGLGWLAFRSANRVGTVARYPDASCQRITRGV